MMNYYFPLVLWPAHSSYALRIRTVYSKASRDRLSACLSVVRCPFVHLSGPATIIHHAATTRRNKQHIVLVVGLVGRQLEPPFSAHFPSYPIDIVPPPKYAHFDIDMALIHTFIERTLLMCSTYIVCPAHSIFWPKHTHKYLN